MLGKYPKLITTLGFLSLLATSVWAQTPTAPLLLRPDAPDRYVVVRGDTLWDISERYTDSPWRWPELWNLNKDQIKNPHFIYPGDVILLDRVRGRLSIARVAGSTEEGTVKLSPRIRAEQLGERPIPSIPLSVIEPFLARPLVVEADGLENAPTIVGTEGNRVLLAGGNDAYVRGIGGSPELDWYVYRKGNALIDPDTNQTLGYEAIYLATGQVKRRGEPATLHLIKAVQEVGTGDKLIPVGPAQSVNYIPRAPQTFLKGRVMSIYGGLNKVGEAGQFSVITINRGRADGLEVGHVLAIYSLGGTARDVSKPRNDPASTIHLPDERNGLAFVFRVFDRVSYALVMNVARPVSTLDVVETP